MYRKLAQVTDVVGADALRKEMRDRYGPVPAPVELLLEVALLKVLASQRGLSSLETKGAKLILIRNDDYVMVNGKFPRLEKEGTQARLNEIRKLVRIL